MSDVDKIEESIVEVSNEVDEFLIQLATKHKQHPLNLSSIILARLVVMCKTTGCLEEFKAVVDGLGDEVFTANTEVTKH